MIATGLATGTTADPAIAAQAVAVAMSRLHITHASSVLLFLSSAFARNPQAAILAASRQGQCLHVTGCSATGVFTEDGWVLDTAAAAAMVFSGPHHLTTALHPHTEPTVLTLTTHHALRHVGLMNAGQRLGVVLGDATESGPHKVWQNGKMMSQGHCDTSLHGCTGQIGVSHGIRALTGPVEVTESNAHELIRLNGRLALHTLMRELPLEARELERIPLHRIYVALIHGEPTSAFTQARYRLIPIVSTDPTHNTLTLVEPIPEGAYVFLGLRQPLAAEASMRTSIARTATQLEYAPDFAIMVSSSARGASFYHGDDHDLRIMIQHYPGMPIIGCYADREIACIDEEIQLLEMSCTFGLFHSNAE